jgi:hypothetical protein
MGRGKRVRIAEGVYRDACGIAATVKVGSGKNALQREIRFDVGTPLRAIQAKRDEVRVELRKLRPAHARGTLAADVVAYLKDKRARLAHPRDREHELATWLPRFGHRQRRSLSVRELQAQLDEWHATLAASTCNHRHTALSNLFNVLDGRNAYNPLREIPKFRPPEPVTRALDYDTQIRPVLKVMQPSATKARCTIMAFCGCRPSQIKRTPREYVEPFVDLAEPYYLELAGKVITAYENPTKSKEIG